MAVPLRAASRLTGSTYATFAPDPALATLVASSWEGLPVRPRQLQVLPDGCADLVWDGRRLRVAGAGATAVRHPVDAPAVGIRLRVGVVGPLLGVPADELPPEGVDLDALWGVRANAPWEQRLRAAATAEARRGVLTDLVAARAAAGGLPDPRTVAAARLLGRGLSVDRVGETLGVSPRALRRHVARDAGPGPKALQRVLRFRRFLAALPGLAAGRRTFSEVADGLGYADQAHLCRATRTLAGDTPSRLVTRWQEHTAGRNVQDRDGTGARD